MRLRAVGFVLAALALHPAAAQDLPPGVLLLSRIKRHAREQLARLPDYTCLETSQRQYKPAGAKGALRSVDTLRLEVLYTGKHELYAAPGDHDFREDSPSAFSTAGLTAGGLFATFLHTLFVDDNGIFTWRGEENGQPGGEALNAVGRRTVRYDFRVPLLTSGWNIRVRDVAGTVAMKGSIWADPDSLELLRLKVQADDVPPTLDVADTTIILDYARTRIGEIDVMLPQTGEVTMLHRSGEESRNVLEYTHCRSFQAQSTLRFEPPPAAGVAPPAPAVAPRAAGLRVLTLPADLEVGIRLAAPITEKESVGQSIEGSVSGNVADKGKVVIPGGAVVTGRIRRLERHAESGGFFVVGIEFTEIRAGDSVFRFYADLLDMDSRPEIGWTLINSTNRVTTVPDFGKVIEIDRDRITTPDLPGVGSFLVRGARFTLPTGFRTVWKTRPLPRR